MGELAGGETPTVLVTRDIDSHSLPLVAGDDAQGVEAAVAHLSDLGHRRVAHVTGPPDLSTTATRLHAFEAAADRRDLDVSGLVIHGEAFTAAAGREAAERLLKVDTEFTAVLAGNDLIALGCLQALAEAGLTCPEDVSVIGHNDTPMVDGLQPPLTTVAIPQAEIGTEAARLLLRRLQGDEPAAEPVLLATKLIVRGSTAPMRPRRRSGEEQR